MGVQDILMKQDEWRTQIINEIDPNKRILEIEIEKYGPKLVFFERYDSINDMYTFQSIDHKWIILHTHSFAIYWVGSGECHEKALLGQGVNMEGTGQNRIVGFV